MKIDQCGVQNTMSKQKFPESLIVTDVREPLIRDVLERKWLEWWDQADEVDCKT